MSESKLEEIEAKAAEVWTELNQKHCRACEEGTSSLQAYTEETLANAAGFLAFNEAFMRGDVDGVMAAMTDDPIFDGPTPQPDGTCFQGRMIVRAVWEAVFKTHAKFVVEESFMTGDRAVVRWSATVVENGQEQSIRGVDVFQLKGGKVAAKLTYTKAQTVPGSPAPPAGA